MSENSRLSIITVVRNDLQGMKETLVSILNQSWCDYQVIVIDGNSDDGTYEYLLTEKPKIDVLIHEADHGIYDAMNKGLNLANGEWVLFLNAGDAFCDSKVLDRIFALDSEELNIISCPYNLIDQRSRSTLVTPKAFNKLNLIIWGTRVANHQSLFVRRSITSNYDTSYILKAELNWYFELAKKSKKNEVLLMDTPSTNYKLGGIGEQRLSLNLREHFKVLLKQQGLLGLLGLPLLLYKFLRTSLRK